MDLNQLHADHLHAFSRCLLDERNVLGDVRFPDGFKGLTRRAGMCRLDQPTFHYVRHAMTLQLSVMG